MHFYTKAPALIMREKNGGVLWAKERGANGQRMFTLLPLDEHVRLYLASEDKMGDEYLELDRSARLFYDMDAEGTSPEEMIAMVQEVDMHTRALLKELFQLQEVELVELDGSRPGKQSRHLIYQVSFECIAQMDVFVNMVRDRCSLKTAKGHICAIDVGKYTQKNGFMRLCYSRKFTKGSTPMMPRPGGEGPDFFYKTLIANPPGPHLKMELPEKRAKYVIEDGEFPSAVALRLIEFLLPFNPEQLALEGPRFSCSLQGICCPFIQRAHTNNKTFFNVHMAKDKSFLAHFRCAAPACPKTAWDSWIDVDLLLRGPHN